MKTNRTGLRPTVLNRQLSNAGSAGTQETHKDFVKGALGWLRGFSLGLILLSGLPGHWAQAAIIDDFTVPGVSARRWTFNPPGVSRVTFTNERVEALASPLVVVDMLYTDQTFMIRDGVTLELSIDLVQGGPDGVLASLGFSLGLPGTPEYAYFYAFAIQEGRVYLAKNNVSGTIGWFFDESIAIKNDNVKLVVGLKGSGENVVLQTRVVDLDPPYAVLFEREVTDTPQADPVVGGSDNPPQSHIGRLGYFNPLVYNSNSAGPSPIVALDNATVSQWLNIPLSVRRTDTPGEMVLSWPTGVIPCRVEFASSLQGPWAVLQEPVMEESDRFECLLQPSSSPEFYRLRECLLRITAPPDSVQVPPGASVQFTVEATGEGTLRYQWRFNGVDIEGATSSTFNVQNAQVNDAGEYTVVVTDDFGSVTSDPAMLSVVGG